MLAAASLDDGLINVEMEPALNSAYAVLLQGVDTDGKVYEHLALEGATYHAFAGEMLQTLASIKQYLDSVKDSASDGTM